MSQVRPENEGIYTARILIADESDLQRGLFADCLTSAGFTNLVFAADGRAAMRQYYATEPDLLLLDIALPEMDGLDVCHRLTARHPGKTAVIIHSALQRIDDRVRAFQAGAVDFINKPVFPLELIARLQLHLENRWLIRDLQSFHARLAQELEAARAMQRTLLPVPAELERARTLLGIDVAAHCEMSSELGGDIWGLKMISATKLGVYCADFSGHGVASAMNAFRLHALLGETGIRFERPDLVLQAINIKLAALLPPGTFATMFYGVIDLASNIIHYCGAGAPTPLILTQTGQLLELQTDGMPVGIRHWQAYEVRHVPYQPGDSLLLYSDALTESRDTSGAVWDLPDLARHVGSLGQIQVAATALKKLCALFNPGRLRPLPDDLTLILLRRIIEVEVNGKLNSPSINATKHPLGAPA